MRAPVRHRRGIGTSRRGGVLPLVCVLLTVLLGAAALGIDLARLNYAGVEAQTAADAAALAAARYRQYRPWDFNSANVASNAQWLASLNRGAGAPATVAAADVAPVNYNPTTHAITAGTWAENNSAVRVTAAVRVPAVLRGIFGDSTRTVRRSATAWVANVNGAQCVRPFTTLYTRFYEEGATHDNRFTSTNTKATDFTFTDVASTQYTPLPQRTFVLLRAGLRESQYDSAGYNNHGNWTPADFTGGGVSGYTTHVGAPTGSANCANASATVGDYKNRLAYSDTTAMLDATYTGIAQLCNRSGTAPDAHCRTSTGAIGVKTRIMMADTVTQSGVVRLHVREVGVVRIMCYWNSPADVCNDVPMNEIGATGTWTNNGPRTGYPRGTIAMFLDTPGSTAITPDIVLGNKPGLTQRLMLVK